MKGVTCAIIKQINKSKFVERFPELSLFYRLFSQLDSEMICIFPYFCPCEESAREIRGFFIKRCETILFFSFSKSVLIALTNV